MAGEVRHKRDPEGTRRRILDAATEEFSRGGLGGARVDRIARLAETNERMLYYYYGSKEDLFLAVLEHHYSLFIEAERALPLDGEDPETAIVTLARFVWGYYADHPELLRLLNSENLHEARHLKRSTQVSKLLAPVVEAVAGILRRGEASGAFRRGLDPARLYLTISALGYFVLSNRHTLAASTGHDFALEAERAPLAAMHLDMLRTYLRTPAA